jgi:hypothetical protein
MQYNYGQSWANNSLSKLLLFFFLHQHVYLKKVNVGHKISIVFTPFSCVARTKLFWVFLQHWNIERILFLRIWVNNYPKFLVGIMYIVNGTLITSKIWYKLITKLVVHKGELKNIGMIVYLDVYFYCLEIIINLHSYWRKSLLCITYEPSSSLCVAWNKMLLVFHITLKHYCLGIFFCM